MSTWLQVAAWLSSIALITALINYLLEEKSKAAIRERASQIWFNFESRDALVVVKTPLELLSRTLDRIYGTKILSWKDLWRTSLISLSTLVAALFLLGAFVGKPFGVETPPWKSFDETFAAIESLPQHQPVGATAEQKASTQRLVNILKPYNQPKYRLLYTACFFSSLRV